MKRILLSLSLCLLAGTALRAQITITGSDMPVNGDTLRYSSSLPSASLNLGNTGAGITWDYYTLTPIAQTIDTYKTAAAAGYTGGGIPATAFGYKVADSIPGAPISVTNVYTFFNTKTGPSRFVAEGFGAKVSSVLPVNGGYSNEDTIYNFPLTFSRMDSSTFKLTVNVTLLGASLKQQGKRTTMVDGWGTLTTPFVTSAPVLRVRSEVNEIDSITFGGTTTGLPRHYVEYKWLANGQHGALLQINTTILGSGTTETPSSVRYRDANRNLVGIHGPSSPIEALQLYPNPAAGAEITVKVPGTWSRYVLYVYDAAGRLISEVSDTPKVATGALPAGKYTIIADGGGVYGVAQFVK
jgi:hypothetical protein